MKSDNEAPTTGHKSDYWTTVIDKFYKPGEKHTPVLTLRQRLEQMKAELEARKAREAEAATSATPDEPTS